MPITVVVEKSAAKFLKKLRDKNLYYRISVEISRLEENFTPHGAKKIEGTRDFYRLRVGDYRIVYQIESNLIKVIIIEHRKEVYRLMERILRK